MRLDDMDAEVQELVDRLDRLVPRDGAHLIIPADSGRTTVVGNRLGYLRLGIELLRAALDPVQGTEDVPPRIDPDVGYLLAKGSDAPFDLCELDESIASRPPVQSGLGPLGQLAAGVLVVALLIVLFLAAAVAWRWAEEIFPWGRLSHTARPVEKDVDFRPLAPFDGPLH